MANEDPNIDNTCIENDALSKVLGPDHRGRVRGLGVGITPTRLYAHSAARVSNSQLKQQLTALQGTVELLAAAMLGRQNQVLVNQIISKLGSS